MERDLLGHRAVIGEEDIKTMEWSGGALPAGFMSSPAQVIGRGLLSPIEPNEPIMAGKLAAPTKTMGMSLPSSRGTFPVDAYVFPECVAIFAGEDRALVSPLLGAAITHEVGHLFLAGNAHTVTGLMSARWGPKEKKDALMGGLTFSRRQSEQIRADVSQRMSRSNQPSIAYDKRAIAPVRGR